MRSAIVMLLLASTACAAAAEFPQAEISNGIVKAKILLPDAARGYYRGTRFDWSGVIESLQYNGHNYFGQWFEKYDPNLHDAIMGPVEEFRTNDSAIGYDQAKPGDTFIKIGVGVLRKPNDAPYKFATTYEIVNGGKWSYKTFPDHVEFTHELKDASGIAYLYTKTVRLVKGKPELVLEHRLRNTGTRVIETSVYDHNFFMIDGQSSGPDFTVKFPFQLKAVADISDSAVVKGNELTYTRELPAKQSVFTELQGYGATSKDYDIRVENRKDGGHGVHVTGDQPLTKVLFWSIRTTVCPEPYISMQVEPGKTSEWKITYDFY